MQAAAEKPLSISTEALGSGGFGTVFKAKWGERAVAVKRYNTEVPNWKVSFDKEAGFFAAMQGRSHQNVMTIYACQEDNESALVVMECLAQYTLIEAIEDTANYTLEHLLKFTNEAFHGLAYCHSLRVAHCDFKPENVGLSMGSPQTQVAKLLDFGAATHVDGEKIYRGGSVEYAAPEHLQNVAAPVHETRDTYAAALVLFSTLYDLLWPNFPQTDAIEALKAFHRQLFIAVPAGFRPIKPSDAPEGIDDAELYNLITHMWAQNPYERPTMAEAAQRLSTQRQVLFPPAPASPNKKQYSCSPSKKRKVAEVEPSSAASISAAQPRALFNARPQ